MKKDMIYSHNKKEKSIVYLKDGFTYLHLKEFDTLSYEQEMKYKSSTILYRYTAIERQKKMQEVYNDEVHDKESKIILEELKDSNYPVFIKISESVFNYTASEYVKYQSGLILYTYRRNILLKRVNKIQKKIDTLKTSQMNLASGFLNKFISMYYKKEIRNLEQKVNAIIEKELINYISDIRNEFDLLRLPKELFDELKTHILLSGKKQIEKTTIILDDILEKFFRLHYVGKTTDIINGYDLLIKSSYPELVSYVKGKISLLKDYSSSVNISDMVDLDEQELLLIDELKQKVFKEQ